MKRQLIYGVTVSLLAFGAVTAHGASKASGDNAVAEYGSEKVGPHKTTATDTDHVGANATAADGADHAGANAIAATDRPDPERNLDETATPASKP
jgi:hypothetical protein